MGVPKSRIFIIDPRGSIQHTNVAVYRSTYTKLNALVDHIFPPHEASPTTLSVQAPVFNEFHYWRPAPRFSLEDEEEDVDHTSTDDVVVTMSSEPVAGATSDDHVESSGKDEVSVLTITTSDSVEDL